MVAAFPLAKLATLVIKQVSKPLANAIKERAKQSYLFRTYFCMPPAQIYHWCESPYPDVGDGPRSHWRGPKLNEAMAIDLGANMLGEGIILGIATAVLVYEYNRSASKEEARELAQETRLRELEAKLQDLNFTTEEQDTRLRELTRRLLALDPPSPPPAPVAPSATAPPTTAATTAGTPTVATGKLGAALRDAQSRVTGGVS